jgi:outer membrane protein OmpA-like peptidoglycan-associated protein
MAMKYVKLFENWLLTEGVTKSFDSAKPDAWPVLDTKIKDAIKADFSPKFLESIFKRSLDDANKNKLFVRGGEIAKAAIKFNINAFFQKYYEKNTTLKTDLAPFVAWLTRKDAVIPKSLEEDFTIDSFQQEKKVEKINTLFDKIIENLSGLKGGRNTSFVEDDIEFKKMFFPTKDTYAKVKGEKCLAFMVKLKEYFDKQVEYYGKTERRYIRFSWGDSYEQSDRMFDLQCKKEWSGGGKEEDGIVKFECEDLILKQQGLTDNEEYNPDDENSPLYVGNKFYEKLDGDAIKEADTKGITFGQVMAWLNKWQNGKTETRLLSTNGKDAYEGACNVIFGKEVAEAMPEFAPTNIKISGKDYNLDNSKSGGTVVPLLALNTVYGTVKFDYNSFKISNDGKVSLANPDLWKILKKAKSIIIVGNSDTSGTPEYNKPLSLKRAESVLEELKKNSNWKSISGKDIQTQGNGEEKTLKDDNNGKDQQAAALNRRVEIIIDGQPASDKITF